MMKIKIAITALIFLFMSSCNRRLYKCYHKSFPNENIFYDFKLDSLDNTFSYSVKGGLMNDTIEGNYSVRGNKLILKLYTGRAYLNQEQTKTDSINIQFINSKDHIPIPFVSLKVEGLAEVQSGGNGRVSFAANQDRNFIQASQVNYENFKGTLNKKGDWIIELVPKVNLNKNHLKWKIKKGAIKSKKFELEKCY